MGFQCFPVTTVLGSTRTKAMRNTVPPVRSLMSCFESPRHIDRGGICLALVMDIGSVGWSPGA